MTSNDLEPFYYITDQKMNKLKLPWKDEFWSLVITSTVSTGEIWGRLIGNDYSVSYLLYFEF